MDKLKMHSPNLIEGNISKLAELFPNCVTEVVDENHGIHGNDKKIKKAIDFDLLRQELSGAIVEGPLERYHLNWPGKREALLAANAPIARTLRPCKEESVDFDTTQNLFIEGDNLDALKLLQETYLGKVKMIYIDPPYNTGKDFIYKDNFAENTEEYLKKSNQKDDEGNRLVANTDSNGRFHSDWLSMIYPRFKLARNLLKDDGVILVSIGDEEDFNLRHLCNHVFGGKNYYATINWTATTKAMNAGSAKYKLQRSEEYILVYGKVTMQEHTPFNLDLKETKSYPEISVEGRKYRLEEIQQRKNIGIKRSEKMVFEILNTLPRDGYRWTIGEETARKLENKKDVLLINDKPVRKIYNDEEQAESFFPFWTNFSDGYGTSETGKSLLYSLLQKEHGFETVKPLELVKKLLYRFTNPNDIILDFFAGSATTAHAVMQLNAEDGGNRKFIMVQLPEKCDEKSEVYKAGYLTIAEIGKERIRRAGKKIITEYTEHAEKKKEDLFDSSSVSSVVPKLDIGFRVLKIDSSNMADVYYIPDAVEQKSLFLSTDNIKPDRTADDLLFQVLLDWGVDLSLPVTREIIAGKEVFFVDGNALAACFVKDGGITEDFVKELAKRKTLRVVFRDAGFKDDSVKINVEQIFKLMSPHTDVKAI